MSKCPYCGDDVATGHTTATIGEPPNTIRLVGCPRMGHSSWAWATADFGKVRSGWSDSTLHTETKP